MGIRIRNLPSTIPSVPTAGGMKVTNIYVLKELTGPKVKVEYDG